MTQNIQNTFIPSFFPELCYYCTILSLILLSESSTNQTWFIMIYTVNILWDLPIHLTLSWFTITSSISNHSSSWRIYFKFPSWNQFSSVTQLCPTVCDPMDCSMPGLPVHHQLPEFAQTHAYRVGDATQPSHPLSSPSPPAFSLSQHHSLFPWVSQLFASGDQSIGASASASVLLMNIQGWFPLGLTGLISLLFKGLSRLFSSTQSESIDSSVLSLLYGPTLTSIYDYWKSHSSSCSLSHKNLDIKIGRPDIGHLFFKNKV